MTNSHKKNVDSTFLEPNQTKSGTSPKEEGIAIYQLSLYLELCQKLKALSENRFD